MPPTNSPSETRPSTPPPYPFATSGSSLSSHPYLRQLEEAISTPVPDLASTLTTPESRPQSDRRSRIRSRSNSEWESRTALGFTSDTNDLFQDQLREDEAYLARSSEQIGRIQSEVERWQHERNRLRHILHTQQDRQSLLEEQNYRLREHRSRLRQEHQRLHDQSTRLTEQNTRLQSDFSRLQDQQNNLNNLAGAITEVGRDNYATTGVGPSRETLYDWAATRPQDDPDQDLEPDSSGEIDSGPRRELERALRNYRMARNAFRAGRQSGTDVGAVPTASALRAYWNEDPPELPQPSSQDTSTSRPQFALSEFVEQHRVERQRRHLENVRRHNEQRARIEGQYDHHRLSRDLAKPSYDASEPFMRVRNTLRYLSQLRETNLQGGLDLARSLGIDSLYENPDMNTPSDLPMTIESLPEPQPSSWLKPGMTWQGLQSTDREPSRPTLLASTLRRIRQRDYVGRAMARRGYTNDHYSQHSYRSLQPIPPEDTDRYLTNLMHDPTLRWSWNDPDSPDFPGSNNPDPSLLIAPSRIPTNDADHWPVAVTLHEVNWDNMTVAGTMRASQIPDNTAETESRSMESYFQGEIIDFCHHTLQSDGSPFGYKVGGVDIDARYWARLGPFKREIDRSISSLGTIKKWDGKTKHANCAGKDPDPAVSTEDRQKKELEAEEVMARCLGSTKWLREKVGGEWILMRWKERCFVGPIMPLNAESASAPPVRHMSSEYPSTSTTLLGDRAQAQWGLTISGFYYIALHRQTGRIDGLYYDPGSQPYQSLRMAPEGCKLIDDAQEAMYSRIGVDTAANELEGAGLKKWFPAVEFR